MTVLRGATSPGALAEVLRGLGTGEMEPRALRKASDRARLAAARAHFRDLIEIALHDREVDPRRERL